ncbi:MAG: S9 family peptidase [Caulobacter sp.]|nr:S9 family peptidase [Caulobacter sp.]
MKAVVLAVLALLGLAVINVAQAKAAPPISAFARLPAIEQAEISPDGARVALLGGPPGERTLFLAPVDGTDSVTVRLGQARVHAVRWVNSDYLVVNFSMLDKGTDYSSGRQWSYQLNRNVVISKEGKLVTSLLADTQWSRWVISQPIRAVLAGPPPMVLVQGLDLAVAVRTGGQDSRIQPTADELTAALWKVDVVTGAARIAVKGGPYTQGWDLDLSGEPRVRWDYEGDTGDLIYYVRPRNAGWKPLDLGPADKRLGVFGYADPEDAVYLLDDTGDTASLLRRSLTTGETTPVPLAQPAPDLSLQWDSLRNTPVVVVTVADRPSYQWLDAQLGAVHGKLSKAFAGRDVQLVSWSSDRTRIVVLVESPSSPPAYFLFDTKTNQASALGEAYPELAGAVFGETRWMTYKARDGLDIHAYLTLPPGHVDGAKVPLVVMPHGGPAGRDSFEFDWLVQALATRGYAVLQPQFRGSTGFGGAFEKAGMREWGGKMQEDLIDGVMTLSAKGQIDRARVCIVGASYGGYAALFGATVYPSAFRCAVSINGVSDLALLYGSKSRAFGRDTALVNALEEMMGDPRNDAEAYRLASPVFRVTQQSAPVLLIHGEDDTTVPLQQSTTMQRALKAQGRPVDLVILKSDDHHLSSTASRQLTLESLLAFLGRHLPVGA